MRVITRINNNAAICIDSSGAEVVAIGTGIGFPKVPYIIDDLKKIQRTYYDINPLYLELLNKIPQDIFDVTNKIVNQYQSIVDHEISSNVVFTLSDHIHFALEREKKHIQIANLLQQDVQHLYEREYEIGKQAVTLIYKELGVRLPSVEVTNIALHFVNANFGASKNQGNMNKEIIEDIVHIISKEFNVCIDTSNVNYARFFTHMQYLLKRVQQQKHSSSDNVALYEQVKLQYPDTYSCLDKIQEYIYQEFSVYLREEESLYLMLHMNRLCTRGNTI